MNKQDSNKTTVNSFLVGVFNDILRLEEQSLSKGQFKNLSVSEMHIIDAVYNAEKDNTNTMKNLADKICITASSASTAVKALEKKGYITRENSELDRRKVHVFTTSKSQLAVQHHTKFHLDMVQGIEQTLTETEAQTLTLALSKLHDFFHQLKNN